MNHKIPDCTGIWFFWRAESPGMHINKSYIECHLCHTRYIETPELREEAIQVNQVGMIGETLASEGRTLL